MAVVRRGRRPRRGRGLRRRPALRRAEGRPRGRLRDQQPGVDDRDAGVQPPGESSGWEGGREGGREKEKGERVRE